MSDFKGSIAQDNVQFPIETVIEPIPGAAYARTMIFMHVNLASENLPGVTSPTAGLRVPVGSSDYGTTTGGLLKKWLAPFFALAQAAELSVVLYDTDTTETVDDGNGGTTTQTVPATCPMSQAYEQYKYWGYFKLAFASYADDPQVQAALSALCLPDELYSAHVVGTSDTNVLSKTSALVSALDASGGDFRIIYNPDANINAALAQIGDSLGSVNATGTPIGNDIDMHSFSAGVEASGALKDGGHLNLTALEKAALDEQRIGYNTWVGDGTENVVTEGSLTYRGKPFGAEWFKHYVEYVCKVKCATYITRRNKFRNNAEYQACLTVVTDTLRPFVELGRIDGAAITAPPFSKLPASGDSFVVPDAWRATYIDRIRSSVIYGALYMTQPSK